MNPSEVFAEMTLRIESGKRIEGDPLCAFHGGHWCGTPVAGGSVAVLFDGIPTAVPTEEFYKDGRILWQIDEDGNVSPQGKRSKVAEEQPAEQSAPVSNEADVGTESTVPVPAPKPAPAKPKKPRKKTK